MTDSQTIRLLIVDDEQNIRRLCVTVGKGLGFDCTEAESAEAALARAEASAPDLVVTDLKLPGSSGVDLLRELKTRLPHAEVSIMTGHGSIESE